MMIPEFQTLMLPVLEFCGDQKEHGSRETIEYISDKLSLTPDERQQLLSNGRRTVIYDRVLWARTYMKMAELLESPKRGNYRITKRGLDVLTQKPLRIDIKFLMQFPEFVNFYRKNKPEKEMNGNSEENHLQPDEPVLTPEEQLENAYESIREKLADEILEQLKGVSPDFFERIVVEVIVSMGYGGSRKDAGQTVGRSGDGGIDGIINEDRLGLDIIYLQAKRWQGTVGRPEIQKFAGALLGKQARKGIFITTSDFSAEAKDYVKNLDARIILIDGNQFARFMIDCNVGVSTVSTYEIKRLDSDYFTDEP